MAACNSMTCRFDCLQFLQSNGAPCERYCLQFNDLIACNPMALRARASIASNSMTAPCESFDCLKFNDCIQLPAMHSVTTPCERFDCLKQVRDIRLAGKSHLA